MSFGYGGGDSVGRNAPKELKELTKELSTLKNTIEALRLDSEREDSILRQCGQHRVDLVSELIIRVRQTLEKCQTLASKYETLLDKSQPGLKRTWNKYVKYPTGASEFDSLRSKAIRDEFLYLESTGKSLISLAKNTSSVENFVIWESKVEGPMLKLTSKSGERFSSWELQDEHICFQRFGRYGEQGITNSAENWIECIFLLLLHKNIKDGQLVIHDQGWNLLADIPGISDYSSSSFGSHIAQNTD
ncbi:hypothetical protein FPQ18DRAFT_306826 [Pyronema domesticum]|nr:hypothetical protein FPQ18DRAFT_306826 [Pyronema domesticum]